MTYAVLGNALQVPMADESVDLIVTSPPYFALRSYRDGDEHYAHQIGSEPTPREFLEALWAVMAECWRVLKPEGSCWVNLGDKYAGSGGHNNNGLGKSTLNCLKPGYVPPYHEKQAGTASRRNAPDSYNKASDVRPKSLMGLPWSFANGCIGAFPFEPGLAAPDGQTWILRAEVCWSKPNGLPESVTDRVRRSHEQWFHFTKSPRYFSGVDEVREPTTPQNGLAGTFKRPSPSHDLVPGQSATQHRAERPDVPAYDPLGRLPGSVWTVPSEPLMIPDWARERWNLPDHFAAFPQEFPRRIILGWSPSGICLECGEGRRPVVERLGVTGHDNNPDSRNGQRRRSTLDGGAKEWAARMEKPDVITGYVCACTPYTDHVVTESVSPWEEQETDEPQPKTRKRVVREYHLDRWTPASTRPAVILDPFGGTGTVAMVAKALGRIGISLDLSADYCRLADWRINHSNHAKKTESRTWKERQGTML